jgi:hypothetical protein
LLFQDIAGFEMKRFWLRTLNAVAAIFLLICAASRIAVAADDETLRYLFLIDQSPEMATRQLATVQTIYDIVHSGFDNEIKPGEKFALWFYGSRLQTTPPFVWQAGQETAIARQVANLFTGRIYSRIRPREQTLADAAPYIAASPKITVFIVTDGSQPLAGTPYDAKINAAISEKHLLFMRADKPFVITLMAKNGNWADGDIFTSVTDNFQIPEFDRQNEAIAKALAAVRSAPAPTTPKLDPKEMDKALAALRNTAPATTPQNPGDANEIDKARSALRGALSGNQSAEPQPAPKMQFAPALKEPPKEEPQHAEKPKPEEAKPQTTAAVADSAPAQKSNPSVPATIARPAEIVATTEPPPEAKAAEAKSPPPNPPIQEKPKPVVREEPKPIVQEQPKPPVRDESKTVVPEAPKQIAQPIGPPPSQPEPAGIAAQPKPVTSKTIESPQPSASRPPIQTAAITPPAEPFPWLLFSFGLASIAIGGGFALSRVIKRSKSPGSIITQALPRSDFPRWPK